MRTWEEQDEPPGCCHACACIRVLRLHAYPEEVGEAAGPLEDAAARDDLAERVGKETNVARRAAANANAARLLLLLAGSGGGGRQRGR